MMAEREYHRLNTTQEGLSLLFSFYPDIHILNLSLRMDFEKEINESTLLEAIRLTGMRLPYLRVRLHKMEDQTTVQYLSEEEPLPTPVLDYSDRTGEEITKILHDWTYDAFPDSIYDTQLYFFRLVKMPAGKRCLYFCGQHFIMDGYALLYVIDYLDRVYAALDQGTDLPEAGPLPWKQVEDDWSYHTSERYQKDLQRWARRFDTEPQFTSVNGLGSPEFIEGKRYGKGLGLDQLDGEIIRRPIPAELAQRVSVSSGKLNVSPSTYYLLALRSYLGHVCKTDDVMICGSVTCRASRYEKSCGMDVATQQFFRSVIPGEMSIKNALLTLSEIQNDVLRHPRGHSIDIQRNLHERYGVPFGCVYYSVQYSYLPLFDLDKRYLKFRPGFISNGQTNQPLYLMVLPEGTDGTLSATYAYSPAYTDPANVERLHAFILRFLDKGLNASDTPTGELIEEAVGEI